MCSATSSEHSGLVRAVGLYICTNTVVVETHCQKGDTKHLTFERPAEQATKPRVKQEAR